MQRDLWRALKLAQVDDGIDTTVRVRAMIELWMHDDRLRAAGSTSSPASDTTRSFAIGPARAARRALSSPENG